MSIHLEDFSTDNTKKEDKVNTLFSPLVEDSLKKHELLSSLYVDVMGNLSPIYNIDGILSGVFVIGCLLLVYRYLTVEQFRLLFRYYDIYHISKLCNQLKVKNQKLIISKKFDNGKAYYCLTSAGFKHFRSFFQADHLSAMRIPCTPGRSLPATGTKALHDIMLRDVPYGSLAIDSFMRFSWRTSVHLTKGINPIVASITPITCDYYNKKQKGCISESDPDNIKIIVDGLMIFQNDPYGRIILIEQDTKSESIDIISNKLDAYGKYFNSLIQTNQVVDRIQILFNVHAPSSNYRPTSRTYFETYKNATRYMKDHGYANLHDLHEFVCQKIQAESTGTTIFKNIKKLLEDYVEEGNSLSDTLMSLHDYLKNRKKLNDLLLSGSSIQSQKRRKDIRDCVLTYLDNADTDHISLINAVYSGTSIVIADNYIKTAYYIEPSFSGFLDTFIRFLGVSLGQNFVFEKIISLDFSNEGVSLPNVIKAHDKTTGFTSFYIINEISSDIASRFRVKRLLRLCKRRFSYPIHLLLLVESFSDAIKFAQENEMSLKHDNMNTIELTYSDNNIVLRFMDYSTYIPGSTDFSFSLPSEDKSLIRTTTF